MNPETIALTIQAVAGAVREVFAWLQTPEGRAVVRKSLEDRAAWDRFWADAARGIKTVFQGGA